MAKSQTVSSHLKNRLVTGTLIFWGSIVIAIVSILIEYFSTHHPVLLLAVFAIVVTCLISLAMLFFILPVLDCLNMLELWMNGAPGNEVIAPIQDSPFLNKSTEPFFRACNAFAARLRDDSFRRIQFVERLAHDMRSSLASIQGYGEVLIDYHIGIEGASLQSYGRIITNQTYRLVKMVEAAQTATCILEGRLRLEREPVNLGTLLSALIAEARCNNIREIKYQDDLGECVITGDSFRLHEMISKLVDNALSLSTSYIFIHAQVDRDQSESWVKINVEDHGHALSIPEIDALLHPFELSKEHKTSPMFRNSLSFYIIKAIVDGHNGRLILEPQPGEGTTYTILLPFQKINE
jgi:signal transduction histidine kinase